MTSAETEARAAGIDAAADYVSAYLDESTANTHAAGIANANRYLEPLEHVLDALRKLAAETRRVEPGPFDGWAFKPWKDALLWASKEGGAPCPVGAIGDGGWCAWAPKDSEPLAEGPETGIEGAQLVENALIKAGAAIPWRKGKDR